MTSDSKEITLDQLWGNMSGWFKFLLKKWKIIFLAGVLGGAVGLTIAITSKRVYFGELVFAFEEKSNSLGSYAAIASQFGLDMGGGGAGTFSGDNLVELLKSRLMLEKALISPVVIDNDTILLVNKFIEFKGLRDNWADKPEYATLEYKIGIPRTSYTRMQDSLLNKIQLEIKKKMLTVKRIDKKLSLVSVTCSSEDEIFSKYYTEELVDNTSAYYIETRTKKGRFNIQIIEAKLDSVRKLLNSKMYGAASTQDQNLNTVRAQLKVPLAQKQIEITLLTSVYAELTKNLELSKFAMSRDEPLVRVIDTPIFPLRFEKTGKITATLLGGIIAGLIVIIYLLLKRKIQEGITHE